MAARQGNSLGEGPLVESTLNHIEALKLKEAFAKIGREMRVLVAQISLMQESLEKMSAYRLALVDKGRGVSQWAGSPLQAAAREVEEQ